MNKTKEARQKILKSLTRHSYENPYSITRPGVRLIRLDTVRRIIKYHLRGTPDA